MTPIRDSSSTLLGFVKVTRDLTLRHKAEDILRDREESLSLMVESVQDYAIFMLTPEGKIKTWNRGAERLKGYSQVEAIGEHFSIFYAESERASKPYSILQTAIREGRCEDEGWRYRKDGSKFWANVVVTAVRDATSRGKR